MLNKIIMMLLIAWAGCHSAHANSYMDMITKAPVDTKQNLSTTEYSKENTSSSMQVLGYNSYLPTKSPVVTSVGPKYQAWLMAQNRQDFNEVTHDEIQNFIYMVETGLLGAGLYTIYRYQ